MKLVIKLSSRDRSNGAVEKSTRGINDARGIIIEDDDERRDLTCMR